MKAEATRSRVAAVVLNYRTPDLVVDCVESVLRALDPTRDIALVVDNASGDGSAEKIRRVLVERGWTGRVRLVEAAENAGFAAGNNVGIRAVDAEAYLLLNSDTLVRPGAVETLFAALDADPELGLVSPRLEWPDGTPQVSCFRLHSPWSELIAGSGTGPIRSLLARWDVPLAVRETPFEPEWTSFAAVMLRRETVERVGLLDEGFFMYFEDADYCRRVWRHGLRVRHIPEARVVHLRGGSSPVKALSAARKRRPRYYYASRSRFFRRAYGTAGLLAANLMWTLGRGVAGLRQVLGRKRRHTVERELLDLWRG
jgi:GT2 family glycosyltransferase